VERDAALALLPQAYAVALRLRDDGLEASSIAEVLGVDADALPTLLEVAEAKLRHAMTND
jgi:DNA-directed RNA polymerase specialized sigma24 family protein